MRAELAEHFTVDRPEVVAEQISNDGTRKWLLRLPSGDAVEQAHEVECVYIPETDRGTLCVSSQVGCTLNCSFCHTGTQRLVRNLTAGEIVGQVMVARDRLNDWADRETPAGNRLVTNVVMMGMGEPLYNFDAVRDALLIVADNEGIGISRRRITLSTSGVVPNILRTGDEIGVMLAISLHAVRDELRNELVPLNRKYPIARIAAGLPRLSRLVECAAHHLRICDAEGRQQFAGRREAAGEIAEGHSGQDQPDPVQSVAGHALRVLGLGPDRKILRIHLQCRLFLAGAHAARPRHPRRLRPVEIGDREIVGARAAGAARHGDDGLNESVILMAGCAAIQSRSGLSEQTWLPGR